MKAIDQVTSRLTSVVSIALLMFSSQSYAALDFVSGSTGADGALNITTSVMFDNVSYPALDADGDGVYNFTTINIAAGATVTFSQIFFTGRPIYWLASGDVTINGTIDVSGSAGYNVGDNSLVAMSVPGPGGYHGGLGGTEVAAATRGQGPGGGDGSSSSTLGNRCGNGAGFLVAGDGGSDGSSLLNPGIAYGNRYMLPLLGGSGGGGGGRLDVDQGFQGGGGGAGGGAILIASSTTITVNGNVLALGGNGGNDDFINPDGIVDGGGGGSGGSIRLMADIISGTGTLSAKGGAGGSTSAGYGSSGYIKLESYAFTYSGGSASPVFTSTPSYAFIPLELVPIRITTVGGQTVPANTRAMYDPADIVITNAGVTTIEIEARNIPLGTIVNLTLVSEAGEVLNVPSSALAGTLATSTATADITIPFGFSRFYVQATWN